jgi:hypothetical protein
VSCEDGSDAFPPGVFVKRLAILSRTKRAPQPVTSRVHITSPRPQQATIWLRTAVAVSLLSFAASSHAEPSDTEGSTEIIRIDAVTVLVDDPDSLVVTYRADPGEELRVLKREGEWTLAETANHHVGWFRAISTDASPVIVSSAVSPAPVGSVGSRPAADVRSNSSRAQSDSLERAPEREERRWITILVGLGFANSQPRSGSWDANGLALSVGLGGVLHRRVELSLQGHVIGYDAPMYLLGGGAALKLWPGHHVWFEGNAGFGSTKGCADTCVTRDGRILGGAVGFAPGGPGHSIALGLSTLITDTSYGVHTWSIGYRYQAYPILPPVTRRSPHTK